MAISSSDRWHQTVCNDGGWFGLFHLCRHWVPNGWVTTPAAARGRGPRRVGSRCSTGCFYFVELRACVRVCEVFLFVLRSPPSSQRRPWHWRNTLRQIGFGVTRGSSFPRVLCVCVCVCVCVLLLPLLVVVVAVLYASSFATPSLGVFFILFLEPLFCRATVPFAAPASRFGWLGGWVLWSFFFCGTATRNTKQNENGKRETHTRCQESSDELQMKRVADTNVIRFRLSKPFGSLNERCTSKSRC